MGPLNLPAGGLVYIDATSSLIYSMERVEQYRARLESMRQSAEYGTIAIVSSPLLVTRGACKAHPGWQHGDCRALPGAI